MVRLVLRHGDLRDGLAQTTCRPRRRVGWAGVGRVAAGRSVAPTTLLNGLALEFVALLQARKEEDHITAPLFRE